MSKTSERLLTFFIGIPVIVGCAAFSFWNHFLLHVTILITTTLVSIELHGLLSKSMATQSTVLTTILSDLIPLVTGLQIILKLPGELTLFTIIIILFIVFTVEIWGYDRNTKSFEHATERISSSLLIIIYSGLFMSFVSRMTEFKDASAIISLFLLLIFGCDSCAWFFGITMGKNNRGVIVASPNKSVMGFIGGFVGPVISILIAFFCFPVLKEYPLWKIAVLSVSTSITSIIGDLVESVIKRCVNTKDSGNLIPGRGGLLDSADSIIFTAPVYYLLVKLLLGM